MKPTLSLLFALLFALLFGVTARAQTNDGPQSVQPSAPAIVGSWKSSQSSALYTFKPNGTYVYVITMGGPALRTGSSEVGSYSVYGGKLILARKEGAITSNNGYRQDLKPETTAYPIAMGRTRNGLAMRLTFPTGGNELFYRVPN
jgi:hypothetical protein